MEKQYTLYGRIQTPGYCQLRGHNNRPGVQLAQTTQQLTRGMLSSGNTAEVKKTYFSPLTSKLFNVPVKHLTPMSLPSQNYRECSIVSI